MAANRKDAATAAKGVTMEHRHFACIADIISKASFHGFKPDARIQMADMFAHELAKTNPRFNRERFLAACGV